MCSGRGSGFRGSFLERPGNFSGPKANFKIKTCWIVAQFLAHKPVNFASLIDSFTVLFSKWLKLWSWMQTQNSFPGPKSYRGFRETGPRPLKETLLKQAVKRLELRDRCWSRMRSTAQYNGVFNFVLHVSLKTTPSDICIVSSLLTDT